MDGLDIVGEFVIAGLLLAEDLGDGSLVEGDDEFIISMLTVSSTVLPPIIIWAIEFDIVISCFCFCICICFCFGCWIIFGTGRTIE